MSTFFNDFPAHHSIAAGVMHFTMMKNLQVEQWMKEIDVNCKGTMNGIAAVLPKMLERKSGHIVNISSDAGRKVKPNPLLQ